MASVLILGDIHLGKSQTIGKNNVGTNLNSRVADQLQLLDWVFDQASSNDIEHIVLTGDIWEEPKPNINLITSFISWLKRCEINNINVHIIAGNHDVLRTGYVYTSPLDIISEADIENVHIYKDINTVIIDTAAFTFMPFRDRKSLGAQTNSEALNILSDIIKYEVSSIPLTYKKVVIGHMAIEGSIPIGDEIDDIANELLCPLNMFNGYDYVWMGHVHNPQVMKKENPYIAHIGSMDISNFGETDQKKIIVILDTNPNNKKFETKNIPTRSLKKISVVIPKDVEDTTDYVLKEIEKVKKDLKNSIVKIDVSLSDNELKSVNKSNIEKFLLDSGTFNICGISESKKINLVKKDSTKVIDTKVDTVSAIKKYCDLYVEEKNKEKFIELCMDIYNIYKNEVKE